MDLLSTKWLSEMEMNDSVFNHQWQHMNNLENECFDFKPFPSSNDITTYDYYNNTTSTNNYVFQNSKKSWKVGGVVEKVTSNNSTTSSTIISFGNGHSPPRVEKKKSAASSSSPVFAHHQISNLEDIYTPLEYGEMKKGVARTPEQAQDHVLAERKRREKMTQKFVALSTLIPGLKKLDKATVLGDAINYIKELQVRVKELELEANSSKGKPNEEAIMVGGVKRPRFVSNNFYDNNEALSSCDENIDGSCISSFVVVGGSNNNNNYQISPEIEVRASEGNLMVRVYCKNQTGVIKEVMGEIEKHNLSIITSSVIPFGDNRLHMTIISQMDGETGLITPKDLADNLQTAIQNLV